jgi:hypothetical protein
VIRQAAPAALVCYGPEQVPHLASSTQPKLHIFFAKVPKATWSLENDFRKAARQIRWFCFYRLNVFERNDIAREGFTRGSSERE